MSDMIDLLFKYSPVIGLFLFLSIFLAVIWMVFRPKSKKEFDKFSKIPLKDEEVKK
jgi:cbb3-type cytochrome oxidase subunit 3